MQETRNNCFGSKIRSTSAEMLRSTTLRQAKTGKHECRNITATYCNVLVRCCYILAFMLTCFHLTKGRAIFFRPETIVASFLHLMALFFNVMVNHTSKHQFVTLLCRIWRGIFLICFSLSWKIEIKEFHFLKNKIFKLYVGR